jgi:hypothetical protein
MVIDLQLPANPFFTVAHVHGTGTAALNRTAAAVPAAIARLFTFSRIHSRQQLFNFSLRSMKNLIILWVAVQECTNHNCRAMILGYLSQLPPF